MHSAIWRPHGNLRGINLKCAVQLSTCQAPPPVRLPEQPPQQHLHQPLAQQPRPDLPVEAWDSQYSVVDKCSFLVVLFCAFLVWARVGQMFRIVAAVLVCLHDGGGIDSVCLVNITRFGASWSEYAIVCIAGGVGGFCLHLGLGLNIYVTQQGLGLGFRICGVWGLGLGLRVSSLGLCFEGGCDQSKNESANTHFVLTPHAYTTHDRRQRRGATRCQPSRRRMWIKRRLPSCDDASPLAHVISH